MKFNKIVCIDNTGLENWAIDKLIDLSMSEIEIHNDYPEETETILSRIGSADCILVSWNTPIEKEVIENCPNLKYIGMCCSLYDESSANVDIATARKRGIVVKGIRDYGDEGTIEFIISELIGLVKGIGRYQWKDEPTELTGKKLGIIGMGATGKMLTKRAMAFNMDVYYYNRSRKPDIEEIGAKYLPKDKLLKEVEILSTHLPRNTKVLGEKEFKLFGENKILINTSLGPTFEITPFLSWIDKPNNFAIFDKSGTENHQEYFLDKRRIITSKKVAGWTRESRRRLSEKVLNNINDFLNND